MQNAFEPGLTGRCEEKLDWNRTVFSSCVGVSPCCIFFGYDLNPRGSSTAAPTSSSTSATSSSRASARCPGACPRPRDTRTRTRPRSRLGSPASSRSAVGASWSAPRRCSPRWASSRRSCSTGTRTGGRFVVVGFRRRHGLRDAGRQSRRRRRRRGGRRDRGRGHRGGARGVNGRAESRGETNDTTTDARHPGETFQDIRSDLRKTSR
mmetsp:Transcript_748/g.3088  ORF Transcript_748/g.3088 Transcript_748/m.3088 type:complete len:208 (-) Transcript_748:245-868(-)